MMLDTILLSMYMLLFLSIGLYILKKIKTGWTIEAFFLSWFLLLYVFIPILFIFDKYVLFSNLSNSDYRMNTIPSFYSWISFFMVIIFLASFYFAKILTPLNKTKFIKVEMKIIKFKNLKISLLKTIGIFLSLLSFISLFVYAAQYGGFDKAIMYASLIRSGYGDEVQIGNYVFVKRFISFSLIPILIFIYLKNLKYSNNYLLLCCIPIAVTLFSKIFLFSAKEDILSIGLLIFIFYSIKNKKSYILPMLLFVFVALLSLSYLDYFFTTLTTTANIMEKSTFDILKVFEYFTPQQLSLEIAIQKNNYSFTWFYDLISNLKGHLAPASWFNPVEHNLQELNTYYFWGEYKSVVLPGLLAFGYYSAGVLGIMITGFVSGLLISKVDSFFASILTNNTLFSIFYAYVIVLSSRAISTGMPALFFYDHVILTMCIILIVSFSYKKQSSYHNFKRNNICAE